MSINRWSGYGVQKRTGTKSGAPIYAPTKWSHRVNRKAQFAPVYGFTTGYSSEWHAGKSGQAYRHKLIKKLGAKDPYISSHWTQLPMTERRKFLLRMGSLRWWNRTHPKGTVGYVGKTAGLSKKKRVTYADLGLPPPPAFSPPKPPLVHGPYFPASRASESARAAARAAAAPYFAPKKARRKRRTELELLRG